MASACNDSMPDPSGRLRILLADDHVVVREGLKLVIEGQKDMTVVCEAGDGATAIQQAQELKPGQERKELEWVFVVRDNKATFTPVKTGIAGEKYFEVISGANIGDQVIIGPFSSVRELRDGQMVKIEAATRSSTTTAK